MTDIEKQAREYADDAFVRTFSDREMPWNEVREIFKQTFLAGAAYAIGNQWRKIPTNKDGFADDAQLDKIEEQVPFLVRYRDGTMFVATESNKSDFYDWYSDIQKDPDRFMWLPITDYQPKGAKGCIETTISILKKITNDKRT